MCSRFIIGVAGGTGSGKTTFCNQLSSSFSSDDVAYIKQDNYYHDLTHLSKEERAKQNFDHPGSIDSELLIRHIKDLVSGKTVETPVYDFCTHNRTKETMLVESHKIIILDGILIFHYKELRELFNLKIYIDVPADIRLLRRLERDIKERGRTLESVLKQYKETVHPMHNIYVEPTKEIADIIVSGAKDYAPIIQLLTSQIESYLAKGN